MEKPTKIVNKSQIQNGLGLKGPFGSLAASFLMWALEINKLNKEYEKICEYEGPEFSQKVLELYNIKIDLPEEDLKNFPDGQFVTVSNHAFGGVDGLIISSIAGKVRPDYKILTNFILSLIPALKDTFMPVNPFHDGETDRSSFTGIKAALSHLRNGGSLGLFPAGAVSTWQKKGNRTAIRRCGKPVVEDCPWPSNIAKLIKTSNAPVVPIYFDGGNSLSMHILGRIYHLLRTARLVHELRNKKGKTIRMRIGKPIMPDDYGACKDDLSMIQYLRNRVYALEGTLKPAWEFKNPFRGSKEPITSNITQEQVAGEIASLQDKVLFEAEKFSCLFADYEDIPVTIQELARTREETFRAIGEGTGKAGDTDIYDQWYKHLILWDKVNNKLAGAYRMGIGSEIFEKYGGLKGIYTASLVKYAKGADEFLKDSIELGRSYLTKDYKKDIFALSTLLKGLLYVAMKYPEAKRFVGPVSVSSDYPLFYRSLIYSYLTKTRSYTGTNKPSKPTHPLHPDWLRVNPDQLFGAKEMDVDKFSNLLSDISYGKYPLPTLVRLYFGNNAKAICFNVDPDFNDSLDVFIVNEFSEFSDKILSLLLRGVDPEEAARIKNRYSPEYRKD
jgi:putative hemolysin